MPESEILLGAQLGTLARPFEAITQTKIKVRATSTVKNVTPREMDAGISLHIRHGCHGTEEATFIACKFCSARISPTGQSPHSQFDTQNVLLFNYKKVLQLVSEIVAQW